MSSSLDFISLKSIITKRFFTVVVSKLVILDTSLIIISDPNLNSCSIWKVFQNK